MKFYANNQIYVPRMARLDQINNRASFRSKDSGQALLYNRAGDIQRFNGVYSAQIAQLITELFRFWCPAKTEIDKVGSKRRYFGKLAVIISAMVIEDSGLPILYLKFDFNTP